jgi:hypothetical protein
LVNEISVRGLKAIVFLLGQLSIRDLQKESSTLHLGRRDRRKSVSSSF